MTNNKNPAAEPEAAAKIDRQDALYAATRAALIGLAETVPWNSLLDYDVAVELLDALHGPFVMPAADPPPAATRQCLYDQARSGLGALTRYEMDGEALRVCRSILDVTWAADLPTRAASDSPRALPRRSSSACTSGPGPVTSEVCVREGAGVARAVAACAGVGTAEIGAFAMAGRSRGVRFVR